MCSWEMMNINFTFASLTDCVNVVWPLLCWNMGSYPSWVHNTPHNTPRWYYAKKQTRIPSLSDCGSFAGVVSANNDDDACTTNNHTNYQNNLISLKRKNNHNNLIPLKRKKPHNITTLVIVLFIALILLSPTTTTHASTISSNNVLLFLKHYTAMTSLAIADQWKALFLEASHYNDTSERDTTMTSCLPLTPQTNQRHFFVHPDLPGELYQAWTSSTRSSWSNIAVS